VSKGPEMQVDIKPGYLNNYVHSEAPKIKEAHKITETAIKDQEYTSRIEDVGGGVLSSNSNAVDVEWDSDQI
jgi:hypothetical protein